MLFPSIPAHARARAADTYMSSPSWTCETRRSRMPVRLVIHSSLVSRKVAMSAFVRTAGGRHLPQPMIAAPLAVFVGMGWEDTANSFRVHAHDRAQLFPLAAASLARPGPGSGLASHRERLH